MELKSLAQWHLPVVSALERGKRIGEFKVSLSYMATPCLTKPGNQNQNKYPEEK